MINGNEHRLSADQTRFQQSSKERFAHAGRFCFPLTVQILHLAKQLPFTDKSIKMGALSINLNEILAELIDQHWI